MSLVRVDVEPDTDEWLEERRSSVGASEAADLIGLSAFGGTPLGLYLSKIGQPKPFDPTLGYVSHAAEPLVDGWVRKFRPDLGELSSGYMARRSDAPWVHATFDRLLTVRHGTREIQVPLQIKTSHPFRKQEWDNGLIPHYQVQEDIECFVLDAPYAEVVVWHYGTDFEVYRHYPDPERTAKVIEAARVFMGQVKDRKPPSASFGDDLAALYPQSLDEFVTADDDALEAWELLVQEQIDKRRHAAEHDLVIEDAKFQLEQFMQSATHLLSPDGQTLLHTWKENKNGDRRHFTPKKEQERFK